MFPVKITHCFPVPSLNLPGPQFVLTFSKCSFTSMNLSCLHIKSVFRELPIAPTGVLKQLGLSYQGTGYTVRERSQCFWNSMLLKACWYFFIIPMSQWGGKYNLSNRNTTLMISGDFPSGLHAIFSRLNTVPCFTEDNCQRYLFCFYFQKEL